MKKLLKYVHFCQSIVETIVVYILRHNAVCKSALLAIITLIFVIMPFSASLVDDFTRAMCSASDSIWVYSVDAESHSTQTNNNKKHSIKAKSDNGSQRFYRINSSMMQVNEINNAKWATDKQHHIKLKKTLGHHGTTEIGFVIIIFIINISVSH